MVLDEMYTFLHNFKIDLLTHEEARNQILLLCGMWPIIVGSVIIKIAFEKSFNKSNHALFAVNCSPRHYIMVGRWLC